VNLEADEFVPVPEGLPYLLMAFILTHTFSACSSGNFNAHAAALMHDQALGN
jgi:hypothetical protein